MWRRPCTSQRCSFARTFYMFAQLCSCLKTFTKFGSIKTTFCLLVKIIPMPVAARSKASVCGRSLVGAVGSNPAGGMDVCRLWVLCVVRYRSLRWADHSSRGVLPTVVRRCAWSRNLVNEEALPHWGLLRHKKINFYPQCQYLLSHFVKFCIADLHIKLSNIFEIWDKQLAIR